MYSSTRTAGAQIAMHQPQQLSWRLDMQEHHVMHTSQDNFMHERMSRLEGELHQLRSEHAQNQMQQQQQQQQQQEQQFRMAQTTDGGFYHGGGGARGPPMLPPLQQPAFTPPSKRQQGSYLHDMSVNSTEAGGSPLGTATDSGMTPSFMASPAGDPHFVVSYQDYQMMHDMHKDMIQKLHDTQMAHAALLVKHQELLTAHADVINRTSDLHVILAEKQAKAGPAATAVVKQEKKKHPSLGVIRLDYNYPPGAGDADAPGSFGYDVTYRVIPGLTFEMAQKGQFSEAVERKFAEGIKYLEKKGVNAITGDCGFMMAFQVLARKIAAQPVFMSSMVQCPIIEAAFDENDKILILTANENTLKPQKDVLLDHCGFDVDVDRFVIRGCQDLPGFDAVAKGEAVPVEIVQPALVKMVQDILSKDHKIRSILLECTELPVYADALRAATDLPVWDCITAADFYVSGYKDNPRFGIDDWQKEWDQDQQEEYKFGEELLDSDKAKLIYKDAPKVAGAKPKAKSKAALKKLKKIKAKAKAPVLGVIRLDYNYPPSAGDIDCPGSYDYDVIYRVVPGLTFEMAQSGRMSYPVQQQFVAAVKWLEANGAVGITGDCGFMMAFQPLARDVGTVPVFMSSMIQAPLISIAFDKYDKVLILTANSQTLLPQKEVLLSQCGFDVDDDRFIIKGCQDVPGFDAVSKGDHVDVETVTPGMVEMTKKILAEQPFIRAILLECTELPPYSDALRHATGLPVWDAITCADFFISSKKDNPRFGLNDWQLDWDGTVDEYKFGENLSAAERAQTLHVK